MENVSFYQSSFLSENIRKEFMKYCASPSLSYRGDIDFDGKPLDQFRVFEKKLEKQPRLWRNFLKKHTSHIEDVVKKFHPDAYLDWVFLRRYFCMMSV